MITTINNFKKINEIGDANVKPYDYKLYQSTLGYSAYFKSENNNYEVYIGIFNYLEYIENIDKSIKNSNTKNKKMSIGFTVENKGEIETNENKQFKIMSTILNIVKEVLNKEPNIVAIEFGAKSKEKEKEKGQKNNQRNNFYLKYAQQHLGNEWQISNEFDEEIQEPITILKKKSSVNENNSTYKIVESKKDHRTTISLIDNKTNKVMGKILLDVIYLDSTPSNHRFGTVGDEYAIDDYIYLRYLNIDNDYRGMKLSKILLQEAIKFAHRQNIYEMYLFAIPDSDSSLTLEQLVSLYKSFGFKELEHTDDGVDMVLEL